MDNTVPVTVIIPTFNRGEAVLSVIEKIQACNPNPARILIHIDAADGLLEKKVGQRFPKVGILTSRIRLGPGGARHRCLLACETPYAVSFDDDSYPVDADFFLHAVRLLDEQPEAAIIGASIWHRHEEELARTEDLVSRPTYIGCGYAIRVDAYRQVRGHIPRPIPYGMEEIDVGLQLFVAGWQIYESGNLRVFHDTELTHHRSPEITTGSIVNVGLFVFLHYPVIAWGRGLLQMANKILYCVRVGRFRGIGSGLLQMPGECYRYRHLRRPVPLRTLREFLQFCKAGRNLEERLQ
jgi:GT2 family glycosyltransferase